jgi:tight adherence protein C
MNEHLVIPILLGFAVVALGGALLMVRWARRAPLEARLQGLIGGGVAAAPSSASGPRLSDVIEQIGTAISSRRASTSLSEQLTQAGYHDPNAAAVYLGAKVVLLIVGLLISGSLTLSTPMGTQFKVFVVMTASLGLFFVPNMIVSTRRARRAREIRRYLADAIDLLEICASSGMGIDMAWNSVAEEVRPVSLTLADEMALTNLEIHLGAKRADAMRHMARRTGADELSSLVAVLVQSEKFGTSITDALRNFATSMREARSLRAQETAEKMAIKLIFPMIMFIFPAAVMVMAGPAFIALFGALKAH